MTGLPFEPITFIDKLLKLLDAAITGVDDVGGVVVGDEVFLEEDDVLVVDVDVVVLLVVVVDDAPELPLFEAVGADKLKLADVSTPFHTLTVFEF